jgi:hypothetical protein
MPDYTAATARACPVETGMFNIARVSMKQEIIDCDEVMASSRKRGGKEETKEK